MTTKLSVKWASNQVARLLMQLTLYYALAFGFLYVALRSFPGLMDLMPLAAGLVADSGEITNTFAEPIVFSNLSADYVENALKLLFAILGVIQVMLPVTWVYLKIRASLDQSLVETMLILPIVVA